jgi:hypothetical protein
MRHGQETAVRAAIGGTLLAAALATGGFVGFPVAAVAGGALLVALGAALAYDLRGLGARWIEWKRSLGGPTFRLSAWLDRTLDGAAVAWLGVAVAWVGVGSLV